MVDHTLLFLGSPGSGKDTQANLLAEKYGFTVVSTGQLLREFAETPSPQARAVAEYMHQGKWVPDDTVYSILRDYLNHHKITKLILTGAVRTVEQIPLLDKALSEANLHLSKVIYFDLKVEQAIQRLANRWYCPVDGHTYDYRFNPPRKRGTCDLCGEDLIQRDDDQPAAVQTRFAEMARTMNPILEVYKNREQLLMINAAPSVELIHAELVSQLEV